MTMQDKCCSVVPYFTIAEGKCEAFKTLCEQMVAKARTEAGCLYYGFCFNGDQAHCREGFADGDAVLIHLDNVGALLQKALQISDLTRLEIHGQEAELKKLYAPLAHLQPAYFVLECGFRR